jgi:hypothetical protein
MANDLEIVIMNKSDSRIKHIDEATFKDKFKNIVSFEQVSCPKGRFMFDDLKTIWNADLYPRDKHVELTRLMEKFELCFNITGTHIHIIPELLPPQRPAIDFDTYRAPDCLHFLYQYDFMPEGIISRFISRNYYFIRSEHFWKTGAKLTFEDSRARHVIEKNICDVYHLFVKMPSRT